MNSKIINLARNFFYTISSNLITLMVSAIVVFIIPKLIGMEEYGYWQLFLFYSSYVPFLQFGWSDGVYLRYGGKEYDELDKKLFFSQFIMLLIFQVLVALSIIVYASLFVKGNDKIFIFQVSAIYLILVNVRYLFSYILQATNRFKENAKVSMIDRIFYLCLIISLLLFGIRDYRLMIMADLAGKLISLLYSMYCCNDIVFNKFSSFYISIKETILNINSGIKLTLSNTASMLVMGSIRFGIEKSWDVSTFGKVSLTLNISNFIMIFINAVGIIIFPILRRTNEEKLSSIYEIMRTFLMVILLGILIVYYPLKTFLSAWLPQYSDSLIYMSLVFPISIYEGKMALLINTYFKTLRKENLMLKINFITFMISIIVSVITTVLINNLNMAITSIVIILAFRSILSEVLLSKIIKVSVYKDILLELFLTVIFIISGWFLNALNAILIYLMAYAIYLYIKKNDIKSTLINIKALINA